MSNEKTELLRLKHGIETMLKKAPTGVLGGSYQRSVAYKEAVSRAQKALKTPNSLSKLSSAHNELASYF